MPRLRVYTSYEEGAGYWAEVEDPEENIVFFTDFYDDEDVALGEAQKWVKENSKR